MRGNDSKNVLYMDVALYGAEIALQNLNKQTFETKYNIKIWDTIISLHSFV
jgi:hypothetical protein